MTMYGDLNGSESYARETCTLPKIMSMRTHFELICISNFHI